VGTLARAERATWTGAGGSACQTRVPCALTVVFIASGLLVCLVGDKNIVGLSSASPLCGICRVPLTVKYEYKYYTDMYRPLSE